MAIRLLDPETKELVLDVNFAVKDFGDGQTITGFKKGLAVGGFIHTRNPLHPTDVDHVVKVEKGPGVRVTLTQLSPKELIAKAY